jgi:hypothetical protein
VLGRPHDGSAQHEAVLAVVECWMLDHEYFQRLEAEVGFLLATEQS